MGGRSLLGPADVSDDKLAGMVADLLGHDTVEVLDSTVERVAYDVPSITTVGRHWVSGTARTPAGEEPFRLFVKHVQAWQHSPTFQQIPAEVREIAAASYPWRIEAEVYRSDLARRLPEGLSMPRAVGVFDVDPDSVVVWLETVPEDVAPWDLAQYERAAYLLGRLAARPGVLELSAVGNFPWDVTDYVDTRLQFDVIPQVQADETWQHPAVARLFGDDLRDRLRAACGLADAYGRELAALPHLASHGDACRNNLLGGQRGDLVLIDFGLWLPKPVGHDLGQLVAGELQLGRAPTTPLGALDERCVAAYARGLADEGFLIDIDVVRRAHALQLFLFNGAPGLPEPGEPDDHIAARALLVRHSLDLLDAT